MILECFLEILVRIYYNCFIIIRGDRVVMELFVEAVFAGLVSKMINDITDISNIKNKIIEAVRKSKHKSIESQIYKLIVNVLNDYTKKIYKENQDKIYDAVEELLIMSRNRDDHKAIVSCLHILNIDVNENECKRFKLLLCEELGKDEFRELFHSILLLLLIEHKNQYDIELIEQLYLKLNEVIQLLDNEKINEDSKIIPKIKSRTQEYMVKWDENMFLNNFSEWDGNYGANIKLKDLYINEHLPHFYYNGGDKKFDNLNKFFFDYFFKKESKMLLILGQPAIGKSTLITWIANNFININKNILIYQFASDLKDLSWDNFDIGRCILEGLGLSYSGLNGKILIIDGFDEINVEKNRKDLLNKLYEELINSKCLNDFKLIITCRENYVDDIGRLRCDYITLQPWNVKQIRSFCKIYNQKTKIELPISTMKNIIKNRVILGIPLILYMTLALNISIENEKSIVDIYDKIFSLEGGIYDRCIENRNYEKFHRIGKMKQQIHQVSRELAFWMFENNDAEAFIPQEEFRKICCKVACKNEEDSLKQDFLIGNFLRLKHCEGNDTNLLCFIHRTVYEYFLADYIFNFMYEAIKISKECLAGVLGELFKKGVILENKSLFLKQKIANSELNNKFNVVFETFKLMLNNGMTSYTKKCYKNVIMCEGCIFVNMLELIHLWDVKSFDLRDLPLADYLAINSPGKLNLRDVEYHQNNYLKNWLIYLRGAILIESDFRNSIFCNIDLTASCLIGADFRGANLEGTKLTECILSGTNFTGANLKHADLSGTNLTGVNLEQVDLSLTNISNAIFDEEQVKMLSNKYDMSKTRVYIKKMGTIISFKDYILKK
jgi:DNA replication protein DnaC